MSIAAPQTGRNWFPAVVSIAIVTVAVLSAGAIRSMGPRVETASSSSSPLADPAVQQAPWKLKTIGSGASSRRESAAAAEVGSIVRNVYDALLLDPGALSGTLQHHFARDAASALIRAGLGWPEDTTAVQITKRRARVRVDVGPSARAVAIVRTAAVGETSKGTLRLKQRSTLWIEATKDGWRVFAFDVAQRPSR